MSKALLFLLTLAAAAAAQFPAPPPAPPVPPVVPPDQTAVLSLSADQLYVVDSKKEAVLRAHPSGAVRIVRETGPIRMRGRFVDGSGAVETRTYQGPSVFLVEPIPGARARVSLDLIPIGLKAESEIVTAQVDVNGGAGPQPPPPKPVEPKPADPVPVKVETFRVIWVRESDSTLPAGQAAAKDAQEVRRFLTDKCTKEGGQAGWREYDPHQVLNNEQPEMTRVWEAARAKLPDPFQNCVVVQVNNKIVIESWPADARAALALFEKHLGGK